MNTTTHTRPAERLGRWLGRGWRGYVRSEHRVSMWLVAKGVPAWIATALVWAVKLAVLGMLFYVAFWIAVLGVSIAVWMWTTSQNQSDNGFEFTFPTTIDELREAPGYDPNLYGDISHEMYRDE